MQLRKLVCRLFFITTRIYHFGPLYFIRKMLRNFTTKCFHSLTILIQIFLDFQLLYFSLIH
jgi:hypothetical protein